ncbi:MAG: hypothetical protein FRX48_00502 [Lasallia pustulata]|uniref:Myb-like domain-containing protein n=1 Tax=Lasallia pustulata TaxID=136370 RepID=A0A5M8Q0U7_9LECA|nr:MAG: hypothetical protein FRX48_00502 [Lasallia pustulata]
MSGHHFSESEWSPSNFASLQPLDYDNPFPALQVPPPIDIGPLFPGHIPPFQRPKSSPSTFGPNVEDLLFAENPFRIKQEDYPPSTFPMSPVPSAKVASPYYGENYPPSSAHSTPAVRQAHVPIAPDPVGLRQMNALKRMRDEEEYQDYGPKRRKRAASQAGSVELNEEEQLLIRLKEEENLPWKDIAVRFQTELGKSYQVPALQMRFKRLRERMRAWTETDVQALEQAFDYWERFQFDIIAAKMLDFGATERWPAKYCARKWEELHPGRASFQSQSNFLQDPWDTISPVEPSIHSPRPQ